MRGEHSCQLLHLNKAFLPKLREREAWKASVGYSLESSVTQRLVTHVGTRSHLFNTNTKCLCGAFFFKWAST